MVGQGPPYVEHDPGMCTLIAMAHITPQPKHARRYDGMVAGK